jgi:type 1 fimbriae regulatory protein FimB
LRCSGVISFSFIVATPLLTRETSCIKRVHRTMKYPLGACALWQSPPCQNCFLSANVSQLKALNQEEILRVLKVASEDRRNLAMILLGFKHGMRASKVCGLELKDLDLKNGEITIRRLKGSLKTTQPIADMQGQPLLSEKRVLRAWLEERGNHPSRFVFVSQKSGRLHRSQLHRVFADIAERAGLPKDKRHFHCLKHSLGVSLVEANVNLAVIKQALGHKSIASTAVYTVPTDETAGKAVTAALASMF